MINNEHEKNLSNNETDLDVNSWNQTTLKSLAQS